MSIFCLEKYVLGQMDNLVKRNVGWLILSYLCLQFINNKIGGNENMNELKIYGTQNFIGINIPIIEGGFSENKKVILVKTVAQIHGTKVKELNKLINNNIDEFEFGIDILDLKTGDFKEPVLENRLLTKAEFGNSNNVYLLSEQGYMALIQLMKTEKAKEIRKKLRREYFSMREELNSIKQQKAILLLKIYDGGQDAVVASKELSQIEVEEATAPLIPKAEFHDAVSVAENCINFGKFAASFQNNNKVSFGRNKILDWCRKRDYLCSSHNLKNKPSQQMINSGYMKYKENVDERNGKQYITYTPLLTGKGQIWLTKKLLEYFS